MTSHKNSQISDAKRKALLKKADEVLPFAQNASDGPASAPPAGWKIVAATDPKKRHGKDYGLFAKVYERIGPTPPGEPKYVAAFGSTKTKDLSDIDSDMDIAFLKIPDQHWQALDFIQRVCREKNIDSSDMVYVGHSLGGYLARTVGTVLGARGIWTFNAPGPSRKVALKLEKQIPGLSAPPGDKLVQVRSSSDIVSAWGYHQGIIIRLAAGHSLDSIELAVKKEIGAKLPDNLPPKGRLMSIFDAVSGKMTGAKITDRLIKKIMEGADKKPPPATPPAPPAI